MNRNFYIKFGLAMVIIVVLILSSVGSKATYAAQDLPADDFSSGIVHCGKQNQSGYTETVCGFCDLLVLTQRISNFIFYYLVPGISMLLFLVAGFLIMVGGADPSKISQGTSIFKTTIIGIAVLFGAWMLTTFILNTLAGDDKAGGYFTIECKEPTGLGIAVPNDDDTKSTSTPGPTVNPNDDILRKELEDKKIRLWPQCSQIVTSNCITLAGMRQATISEIKRLKAACPGCDMLITGGTENIGHTCDTGGSSHCNGYKVDYALTPSLNNYIKSNYTKVPCDGGNKACTEQYNAPGGVKYYLEGAHNHWDVFVP